MVHELYAWEHTVIYSTTSVMIGYRGASSTDQNAFAIYAPPNKHVRHGRGGVSKQTSISMFRDCPDLAMMNRAEYSLLKAAPLSCAYELY